MKTAHSLLLAAALATFVAASAGYLQAASRAEPADAFQSEYDFREPESGARSSAWDPARIRRTGMMLREYMRMAHFLHRPFDESMSPLAWTNFIDSIDPQHVYFTAEDLAEFEPGRTGYSRMIAFRPFTVAARVSLELAVISAISTSPSVQVCGSGRCAFRSKLKQRAQAYWKFPCFRASSWT